MTVVVCKSTFKAVSGLAEDDVVNTFHFTPHVAPGGGEYAQVQDLIRGFYDFDPAALPGAGQRITHWLSNMLTGVWNLKMYNLDDPKPRVPVLDHTENLFVPVATTALPAEVACCASYKAAPAAGITPARLRGRIYLGTLHTEALSNNVLGRVSGNLNWSIVHALNHLRTEAQANLTWEWVVYSGGAKDNSVNGGKKPWEDGYIHPKNRPAMAVRDFAVESVSCDDKFDTIRSRGRKATLKLVKP